MRCAVHDSVNLQALGEVVEQIAEAVEGVMDECEAEERFREVNDSCHFCIPCIYHLTSGAHRTL